MNTSKAPIVPRLLSPLGGPTAVEIARSAPHEGFQTTPDEWLFDLARQVRGGSISIERALLAAVFAAEHRMRPRYVGLSTAPLKAAIVAPRTAREEGE